MENKNIIYTYLETLEESIKRIRQMDFTLDMIFGDEDIQDLLDRRMQKAIESCMDIVIHIASQSNLPRKERVSDVFVQLASEGIIEKNLAERLKQAVGFRNILVHEYTQIDYQLAYSDLSQKLDDLESFSYQIQKFIKNPHL